MSADVVRIEIPAELDARLRAARDALAVQSPDAPSVADWERRRDEVAAYLSAWDEIQALMHASSLFFAVCAVQSTTRSDLRQVESALAHARSMESGVWS